MVSTSVCASSSKFFFAIKMPSTAPAPASRCRTDSLMIRRILFRAVARLSIFVETMKAKRGVPVVLVYTNSMSSVRTRIPCRSMREISSLGSLFGAGSMSFRYLRGGVQPTCGASKPCGRRLYTSAAGIRVSVCVLSFLADRRASAWGKYTKITAALSTEQLPANSRRASS